MTAATYHACSIHCRDVTVRFPGNVLAVDNVTLAVPPAKILSLIGPSGCGKTTLLRLMAGLQSATSGDVTVDLPAEARSGETAFVFQQPSLLPWRTAVENVALPLELIGRGSRGERKLAAEEMLDTVGLADARDRLPSQLSGGMKMRVSIARALVTQPSVLLLDEPFAALDDMLRNQLGQMFFDLWRQRRFTAVMVTHNIAESILLSHQIIVMQKGRLRAHIDNPLPESRDQSLRRTPQVGSFYGQVSDSLRGGDE